MRIFILDKEKLTKFNLPSKVSGVFAIDYLPANSKLKRTVSIESQNDKWLVKSNGSIDVGNSMENTSNHILSEYEYTPLTVKDRVDNVGLYCVPSIETEYTKYTLNQDKILIGCGSNNAINYRHDLVLPNHVLISKQQNKWYVQAVASDMCFAYINDKRITTAELKAGDVIFIYGLKIIWMGNFIQVNNPQGRVAINSACLIQYSDEHVYDNAQIEPVSEEDLSRELYSETDYFFHTPRLKQSIKEEKIQIDDPPSMAKPEELPFWLTIGSSLTMVSSTLITIYSTVSSMIFGNYSIYQMLPQIFICIIMIIGSLLMPFLLSRYQKKRQKKLEALTKQMYKAYLDKKESKIDFELEKEIQILKSNFPAISECYSKALTGNKSIIWSKEVTDDDFLTVRLGIGTTKSKVVVNADEEHFSLGKSAFEKKVSEIKQKSETISNVPVTFSFLEKNVSSIICNIKRSEDYINGLLLQILAYHSPQDLKIVLLLDGKDSEKYSYIKYSPHCLSDDKTMRYFGTTMDDIKKISSYLEIEFAKRIGRKNGTDDLDGNQTAISSDSPAYTNFSPYYLIITNNYTMVKNINIVKDVINAKVNLGFSLTILDESMQSLPNECSGFILLYEGESCILEKDINNQTVFEPEIVQGISMRNVVNKLANVPMQFVDEASQLPTSLTFLEMYGAARVEQLNILNRWKLNDPTLSLKTPIGVHTNGDLFILDLHEKEHGPHGLIAGSTGSGKSEFIITFLLSMAVNYHPDEVQFVLIDYKGGGLAGAFENRETNTRIPHVVGTITNLDVSDMNRTLVSINSELKRRQVMFNEAKNVTGESTIDIYKYQHYYREGILKEPVSHLFIVSDEFAELKSQQPEFMNELISTARIGRSLGVHLILATQKPSGVVNDQIWSNAKFRICLKVQDRSDSVEVLKRPDAASLKETGRFYLQVGYDEYFDIGQSGWAGAKYIPTDAIIKKTDDTIYMIDNVGNIVKTLQDPVKIDKSEAKGDQLTNIVKYIVGIAEAEKYVPKKLWLDKIPEFITLSALKEKYNYQLIANRIISIIGEFDNPAQQMQGLLTLDITENNTLIYGTANSGKENLLQTMIYFIVTNYLPEDINLYILDFGAETLKSFGAAPQVGDVCTLSDEVKIMNLLIMIDKELDRRKELFVDYNGNYVDYLRLAKRKLPLIHVIINNNEAFNESMGKLADLTSTLYRDSSKYGVTFTITTGAANSFGYRMAEYFPNKLCLQMPNDEDYRSVLNCQRGLVPAKCLGRGVSGIGDIKFEFQTAYIAKLENIAQIIKNTNDKLKEVVKTHAKRIPVLPDVVSVEHIIPSLQGLSEVPIGVDISSKEPLCYNFIKNKITGIVYNNIDDTIPFFYSLFSIIKTIPKLKIRTIDLMKKFDISQISVDCYVDRFEAVIKAFVAEIDKVERDSNAFNVVYFINGISRIKEHLKNEPSLFQQLFEKVKNSKNVYLIISDAYELYKQFQLDPICRQLVSNQNGIWIGEGIGTQILFKISKIDPDYANVNYPGMAFSINDGVVTPIRMVLTERDETNEK